MKIKTSGVAILTVLFIFGGIILSSLLGYWKTESTKVPAKYTTGNLTDNYNPADIRGSYTFKEISELFDIPLEDLANAFGVTDNTETFKCKDLESLYPTSSENDREVGTNSVRVFVALYKSLPIDLDDTTYFPKSTLDVLKNKGVLSDEQISYLELQLLN